MSFASIGRRRWLLTAVAAAGATLFAPQAKADAAAVEPIRQLCDGLIDIMRAGQSTPFKQRYDMLAPLIERAFDLPTILQVSVGPNWTTMTPDQRAALLAAFQRYTIASYVNNFDNYNGQHFDVQPDARNLPNGEQMAQTKIVSSSGESHELNYVMRKDGSDWKAVDVLADGSISRVAVQRSDFRRLVAQGGAPALIESLNRKTADLSGGALT